MAALTDYRICDFTGQLAGAGATRWLASFGADVIRVEDPVRQGRWDILRGIPPFVDERRGNEFGGAFNNHNVEKRGITLNLKTEKGKALLVELVRRSDVVCENFAAGVLQNWGFDYDRLRAIKPDIVYVSNCGFGHRGPYGRYKTWGPIVQAVSGLTFTSGLPDLEPTGWGYSYMDHTGGYYQAIAILLALVHRQRTGEGQWVDLSCVQAAMTLHGPAILDWTTNARPTRRPGQPHSNRSESPVMVPHGVFPCAGDDEWIAIACRDDDDWARLARAIGEPWAAGGDLATTSQRQQRESDIEQRLATWTRGHGKFELERALNAVNVPSAAVQRPQERIDQDPSTANFGLWPMVTHSAIGKVRVDGQPVHFSKTDWRIERGAPCLGEHNDEVFTQVLGLSQDEVDALRQEGVI